VRDRREGRWSYSSLAANPLGEAHDLVRTLATEQPAPGRSLRVFGDCCG